jgi:hypothetical protein
VFSFCLFQLLSLSFLRFFILCMIILSSLSVYNPSLLTRSVHLISILLQHHISKLTKYFCFTSRNVKSFSAIKKSCAPNVALFRPVRKKNFEMRLLASSCLSAWNSWASTGRIFMKFDIWVFLGKSVEKIQVSLELDKNNGYFTWRPLYVFDHIKASPS